MPNDYVLSEAIRLIKAGQKDAARVILEPFLRNNPANIQAWMWRVEICANDQEKVWVLESCLQKNPGNPQATQALNFFKNRAGKSAAAPASASDWYTPPPAASVSPFAAEKPAPFAESTPATSSPFSTSPFSTSPFEDESEKSMAFDAKPSDKSALPLPPQFETAEPEKPPAKPEKKSKPLNPRVRDILIIVGVCVVFALLGGGYIGGGFYLDGQIGRAFAQRQCATVTSYGYFASMYPQGIFSAVFTSYDQYDQCRLKLATDQAAAAKDWATAISSAQQYLTLYPGGVFAADMNKLVVSSLTAWSQQLISLQSYASGIEKLEQFITAYPLDPGVGPAREQILQAYFAWEKESLTQKNYASAEQTLKDALAYFEADTTRATKIKAELVSLYIAWGDEQIANGSLDTAVKYYQLAGETLPGTTDIDLLIAKAYLKQALDIAAKNDFDRALIKVDEVAKTAQAANVKAEVAATREKILQAYSSSDALEATEQIKAALPLICGGQVPALPIFGLDKKNIRYGAFSTIIFPLPDDLTATTPGQLHYVACIKDDEKEIGTCPYTGGKTLHRLRYLWQVTLYTVTGSVFNSQTLQGSDPPECKPTEPFAKGLTYKKSYGSKPTLDQVVAWIRALNIIE